MGEKGGPADEKPIFDGAEDPEREILKKIEMLNTRAGLIKVLGISQEEDYDPRKPNDFEKILLERKRILKEEELKLKRERENKARQNRQPDRVNLEISGEEAYRLRAQRSQESSNKLSGEEKAKKMMQKMGWRGSGLGAHEQGRTTALIA